MSTTTETEPQAWSRGGRAVHAAQESADPVSGDHGVRFAGIRDGDDLVADLADALEAAALPSPGGWS